MKLYFAGAETPSWRSALNDFGANAVAMSFYGLTQRVKHTENWSVAEHFQNDQLIMLDSGAYSLNKKELSDTEIGVIAHAYLEFAQANVDRLDVVSEFDVTSWTAAARPAMRDNWREMFGDKFMPIWHVEDGLEGLRRLGEEFGRVGIVQAEADAVVADNLITLIELARSGVKLHGVSMTKQRVMEALPWDSVGSLSWLTPSQYGETYVWNGRELKHYNVRMKDKARGRRHRQWFDDNGFDSEAIERDDKDELLRLSVWSWQKYLESINAVTKDWDEVLSVTQEQAETSVAGNDQEGWNGELVRPEPRERELLPVLDLGLGHSDQDEEAADEPLLRVRSKSLMQCNNCFIRKKCPGAKPDAECKYEFPAEVETTTQLAAMGRSAISIQFQRVAFMRMIEQVEGGMLDPQMSVELDRLMKMIKNYKDSERDGFSFTMHAQGPTSGPGLLSHLLGSEAAAKANALPMKVSGAEVIRDQLGDEDDVEDAELVDEEDSNYDE